MGGTTFDSPWITGGAASHTLRDEPDTLAGTRISRGADEGSRRGYFAAKRTIDIILVLLVAPIALPVVAVVGLLIKLETPGPLFFRQDRMGARRVREGERWVWELRPFTFYKLRSMSANANSTPHRAYLEAYIAGDEEEMARLQPERLPGSYKMKADTRITRIGALIRPSSIDEIPQLWNVLKGDMSLVGPRPAILYEIAKYSGTAVERLAARPGLTGWWQVQGRSELSFQEMIDLDSHYVRNQSLWFDIKIMAMTVPVIATQRGAG